ncbi:lytic transglycosylase domain-containing protein [Yersinia enterocolitica]|uniref:lytic transglycosylase domain-containing protein n=1 Tax=Yersinia enterocolitica TaxID=630 RepID=UPI003F52753D
MSGNQMPVLTLDVNDEHLKRLEAIFEKYQNGLNIGPSGSPLKPPSNIGAGREMTPPASGAGEVNQAPRKPSVPATAAPVPAASSDGRFIGSGKNSAPFVSNYKGRGETMFDKYLSSLGKNAQSTLKTYKQINRTLGQTNARLKTLFKTTVSWGTKLAALGAVGPLGYGYMASKVAAQYRNAQELGMTTAQMQAAKSTYSPYFSGTENLVQVLANAQENPNDPNYSGLMALGINPKDGAATNLPKVLNAIASLVKEYKGSGLTQSVMQGRGLGWVDAAFANQVGANLDKIPFLNEIFAQNTKLLGAYLTPAMQSDYQSTASNFLVNGNRISNAWQAAIARYNPQIRGASNSLVSNIEVFLTGGNFEKILTEVEGGLDKLGKWLNSEQFKNDLDDFTKKVSAICSAIGRAVTFIYNLVGEEKGEDNNTINKTNNFVGNIGERSGRTVRDWLRGKGFELGWWTFEDERNKANIQEVEQFAQSARRTHKDNSVTEQYRATYSLPRGLRNNNPGNLKFAGQRGATLEDGPNARFARFPSMVEGIAALDRQVMLYLKRDKNTIDKIIDIYAPSSDGNNTSAYKSYLSRYTGLGLNEKINSSNIYTIQKLIQGIINYENGLAAGVISGEDILKAMAMNRGGGGVISNNPASQVVKLEVFQKPGSDVLAQLAGQMQIPG